MKKARESRRTKTAAATPPRRWWLWALGAFAALAAVFQIYGPVLHGPFLFDDDYLPFRVPGYPSELRNWLGFVRPLLMATYWVNYQISPTDTFWYHVFNVLFHFAAGVAMFFVVRRFLALAKVEEMRRTLLAGFGAALFLLHPVQTESVAYVASRSENLSVALFFSAYAVFVCRRAEAVSWGRAAVILLLAVAALLAKEHAAVFVLLLLLTDYYWNPGFSLQGIRRNWRVYLPVAAGAAACVPIIWRALMYSPTAGFGARDLTWYEYFFTQCRALFVYLRLFVLPFGQTVDYDFPLSRSLFDRGAVFGLIALIAISVVAWIYRRRFPLASFGWFAFLLLMAPTSSIVPIKDPIAERRLYLSMFGLILIVLDGVRRVRLRPGVLAASAAGVLVVMSALAYQRASVWADRVTLWEDAVRKSPANSRAHFQLAFTYYEEGRCAESLPHYQRVLTLQGPTYDLLVDWALAYDCLNRDGEAIAKLREAAGLEPKAHAWALTGMVHAKRQRWQEALDALATAERIEPAYAMTYVYRGGVLLAQNAPADAAAQYRRALALDPANEPARTGLAQAEGLLRSR